MAQKKLGMGSIEIKKKFKDREEAYKHARRLNTFIRDMCKKKADKGWLAQAMIITSELKKEVSLLRYVNNGKRGRPRKELYINEKKAKNWYKGDYKTDWHIHILLVSKPSSAFRNAIKNYVDKNWNEVTNKEKNNFDIKKLKKDKAYKRHCNIKMAEYFINQSVDRLFCNCNYGNEEKLKYNLKEYFNEYLKADSKYRKYCARLVKKWIPEDKQLKELEKIYSKFNAIEKYLLEITKEQDKKEAKAFMKKIQFSKIKENYNKEQNISRIKNGDNGIFTGDGEGYW